MIEISGILASPFLYHLCQFQICVPFPAIFMDPQMSKIRCVNYACFPKSGQKLYVDINNYIHLNWCL